MIHYLVELAIWLLVIFFAGCLIGYLLRRMFGSEAKMADAPPRTDVAQPPLAATAPVETPVEREAEPVPVVATRMERPRGLSEARGGKADDLQRISGIGPKNEKILHSLGFFHFDQISMWTVEQVAWVDDHLRFNGRIGREKWIEQAELLAKGDDAEFERRFSPKS